jgi:tRNA (guanine37-N1)-methyltransferase
LTKGLFVSKLINMQFRILTLFPQVIDAYFSIGVLNRASEKKYIDIKAYNLRDWTEDKHGTIDDTPYGGGAGMVMKAEPIYKALTDLKAKPRYKKNEQKIILLSASGKRWDQTMAKKYARKTKSLIFVCGRYEGIDERVKKLVDEEISLGDFVLTGGEVAAMAMIDSVARLLPGVLGNKASLDFESHAVKGKLEYPQYTKPEIISFGKKKYRVPSVLLSGNHAEIEAWRQAQATKKSTTKKLK